MPTTTKQLAKIAKVSEQTVRNYTDRYGELLSPQARGETGSRLFSDEDVQVFCSIAELRRENVPPDEVIERLQRGDIYVEVAPHTKPHQATPNAEHTTPSHTTALDAPQALMLVRSDLQRQITEIKRTQATLLRAALLWGVVLGAIGGLAAAALFVWALYIFG